MGPKSPKEKTRADRRRRAPDKYSPSDDQGAAATAAARSGASAKTRKARVVNGHSRGKHGKAQITQRIQQAEQEILDREFCSINTVSGVADGPGPSGNDLDESDDGSADGQEDWNGLNGQDSGGTSQDGLFSDDSFDENDPMGLYRQEQRHKDFCVEVATGKAVPPRKTLERGPKAKSVKAPRKQDPISGQRDASRDAGKRAAGQVSGSIKKLPSKRQASSTRQSDLEADNSRRVGSSKRGASKDMSSNLPSKSRKPTVLSPLRSGPGRSLYDLNSFREARPRLHSLLHLPRMGKIAAGLKSGSRPPTGKVQATKPAAKGETSKDVGFQHFAELCWKDAELPWHALKEHLEELGNSRTGPSEGFAQETQDLWSKVSDKANHLKTAFDSLDDFIDPVNRNRDHSEAKYAVESGKNSCGKLIQLAEGSSNGSNGNLEMAQEVLSRIMTQFRAAHSSLFGQSNPVPAKAANAPVNVSELSEPVSGHAAQKVPHASHSDKGAWGQNSASVGRLGLKIKKEPMLSEATQVKQEKWHSGVDCNANDSGWKGEHIDLCSSSDDSGHQHPGVIRYYGIGHIDPEEEEEIGTLGGRVVTYSTALSDSTLSAHPNMLKIGNDWTFDVIVLLDKHARIQTIFEKEKSGQDIGSCNWPIATIEVGKKQQTVVLCMRDKVANDLEESSKDSKFQGFCVRQKADGLPALSYLRPGREQELHSTQLKVIKTKLDKRWTNEETIEHFESLYRLGLSAAERQIWDEAKPHLAVFQFHRGGRPLLRTKDLMQPVRFPGGRLVYHSQFATRLSQEDTPVVALSSNRNCILAVAKVDPIPPEDVMPTIDYTLPRMLSEGGAGSKDRARRVPANRTGSPSSTAVEGSREPWPARESESLSQANGSTGDNRDKSQTAQTADPEVAAYIEHWQGRPGQHVPRCLDGSLPPPCGVWNLQGTCRTIGTMNLNKFHFYKPTQYNSKGCPRYRLRDGGAGSAGDFALTDGEDDPEQMPERSDDDGRPGVANQERCDLDENGFIRDEYRDSYHI